jgi:tRNA(Arg) A34 adenosine deaminase TadA
MCYSTAYWARLDRVYYAAAWEDYDDLFSDRAISEDLKKPLAERHLPQEQLLHAEAVEVWKEFRSLPDGARY